MEYFKKYYNDVEFGEGEVKVLCPFHNDNNPSASINTNDSLFYCQVCQWGGNEEQFIAKLNGISRRQAVQLLSTFETMPSQWEDTYQVDLWADRVFLDKVQNLGLSTETIESMQLGLVMYNGVKTLGIPVFYNKILVDIRRYNLVKDPRIPKMIGNEGSQSGYIIPFDLVDRHNPVYVFEGEKDMLLARELGLNAITLTGGAGALPNENVITWFDGVDLILCYDNDDPGRKGMQRLYEEVVQRCASIHYINIGDVVEEVKEDFYDFIKKYDKDLFDFLSLEQHQFEQITKSKNRKTITITEALDKGYIRKRLNSDVTVSSEFADTYAVPTVVKFKKIKETGSRKETMVEGESKTWFLDNSNLGQLLQIIEVDAKSKNVVDTLKSFVHIPSGEEAVEVTMEE